MFIDETTNPARRVLSTFGSTKPHHRRGAGDGVFASKVYLSSWLTLNHSIDYLVGSQRIKNTPSIWQRPYGNNISESPPPRAHNRKRVVEIHHKNNSRELLSRNDRSVNEPQFSYKNKIEYIVLGDASLYGSEISSSISATAIVAVSAAHRSMW